MTSTKTNKTRNVYFRIKICNFPTNTGLNRECLLKEAILRFKEFDIAYLNIQGNQCWLTFTAISTSIKCMKRIYNNEVYFYGVKLELINNQIESWSNNVKHEVSILGFNKFHNCYILSNGGDTKDINNYKFEQINYITYKHHHNNSNNNNQNNSKKINGNYHANNYNNNNYQNQQNVRNKEIIREEENNDVIFVKKVKPKQEPIVLDD